jgi:hypothetical protein
VRIIIECPEKNDSPLRGRIHLRGLYLRQTSNLLQFGGGPYIERNGDSTTVDPSRCRLHLLSTAYVHRKVIVVPVAGFRMPAPLSAELEHGSMIEMIVNLGGRPTRDIVSVG